MSNKECPNCRYQNAPDMSFCSECGENLFVSGFGSPTNPSGEPAPTIFSGALPTNQLAPQEEPPATMMYNPAQQSQPQFAPPQNFQTPAFNQAQPNYNQPPPQSFSNYGQPANTGNRHAAVGITGFVLSLIAIVLSLILFNTSAKTILVASAWLMTIISLLVGAAAVVLRFALPQKFGGRAFAISSVPIALIALALTGFSTVRSFNHYSSSSNYDYNSSYSNNNMRSTSNSNGSYNSNSGKMSSTTTNSGEPSLFESRNGFVRTKQVNIADVEKFFPTAKKGTVIMYENSSTKENALGAGAVYASASDAKEGMDLHIIRQSEKVTDRGTSNGTPYAYYVDSGKLYHFCVQSGNQVVDYSAANMTTLQNFLK